MNSKKSQKRRIDKLIPGFLSRLSASEMGEEEADECSNLKSAIADIRGQLEMPVPIEDRLPSPEDLAVDYLCLDEEQYREKLDKPFKETKAAISDIKLMFAYEDRMFPDEAYEALKQLNRIVLELEGYATTYSKLLEAEDAVRECGGSEAFRDFWLGLWDRRVAVRELKREMNRALAASEPDYAGHDALNERVGCYCGVLETHVRKQLEAYLDEVHT